MKSGLTRLLFVAALTGFVGLCWFPISTRLTRLVTIVTLAGVLTSMLALWWQRTTLRWSILGLVLLGMVFFSLPGSAPEMNTLRADYLKALRSYEGVPYVWGGENSAGIDCSGLVRRGLMAALTRQGVRSANAKMVRMAFDLWWHDCSARDLGDAGYGLTSFVTETKSLRVMDHALLRPGDLAVTTDGLHVMAYLGDRSWIEADPVPKKVIISAADDNNVWMSMPMRIVRWKLLSWP